MSKRKSKKRNSSNVRNEQPQQGSRNDYMKAFAKKLIDIIKQADANGWQKGWKSNSFLGFPQNYRGSSYSGGNSMFLLFMSRLKGYKTPIFLTLKQAGQLDSSIKKGEHGVPVFKWGFSYRDKDGKKYDEKQVNAMSKEDRDAKGISGHPFVRTYTVFNLDQTNYAEVHSKRYQLLLDKYSRDGGIEKMQDTEGMFKDEAIDKMVSDNQWVCPVKPDAQQDAYYSAGNDIVVVPTKSRFKIGNTPEDIYADGMEYYSTLFHEMAHSTGHPSRLNRTFGKFGTPTYAREELVAESTAALLSMSMGYNGKVIKNSGAYLANWQRVLAGKPEDIVKIMSDVSKASDMIIERIDKQRVALNQASVKAGVSEGIGIDLTNTKPQGKTLYDLQAQYDNINNQYPFAVDDDRTRQIAKRINQAKEIMTAYNNNVANAYGDDFLFSKEAMTTVIPHAVYSGREQVQVEWREQAADTVSEPQSHEEVQEKASPAVTPTSAQEEATQPMPLAIPVWEAYRSDIASGKDGDFTFPSTAEEYGKLLKDGLGDLLDRVTEASYIEDEDGYHHLKAKIDGNDLRISPRDIPEELGNWLMSVPTKSESYGLSSTHVRHTGEAVNIVAAYVYSDLIQKEVAAREEKRFFYQGKSWNSTLAAFRENEYPFEVKTAFMALRDGRGNTRQELTDNTVGIIEKLKLELDLTYEQEDISEYDKSINLLKTNQLYADYVAIAAPEQKEQVEEAQDRGIDPDANPLTAEPTGQDDYLDAMEEAMEKQTANGVADDVSLAEDSNPQTDVAGVAELIMETGHVSKETAEKKAATIVEAQQAAVNEKKQKADQAKQEAVKKADEARKAEEERRREAEEQRRREEENNRQGKDGGPAAKIVLHAALLLGALELAKGNKGVWMNKAGKSNAEFIGAKRPIMAYNNIMMNLQSDQKGYRSNVYTTYDSAKDNGRPVKQNESSLGFNWTRWDYQNIATKEVISREDYANLPAEEKEMYSKHNTHETHDIFNIDQTVMPAAKHGEYIALLKDKGAKIEELSERGVSSMMKFSEKLKANHPTALVIARTESKYEFYGSDATRAGKLLNLPVGHTDIDGKAVKTTGFPLDRIDDYLPKLVQAKQWVVVADNLDSAKLIRSVPDEKEVLDRAYSTARNVAKATGIGYERVMVLQDAEYDRKADKIIVSGMADKDSGSSRQTAIEKANDIYRAVVAATGSEQRLDRMGRNNLLPKDDAKYERFVQDLASGVLMARQGLPATLPKESMGHIGYWQRELRENPKLVGLLEKDVNNAVESIDKHLRQQAVRYEDIRKDLPPKDLVASPRQFQISTDLAKLPDIDSKEIVIVRDKAKDTADVILPEGASLEDNVEISGIRKDRIRIALGHEGITNVRFYNAGGALGLKEPNDYYKDKAVSMERLKQYELNRHKDIDVTPQIAAASKPKIEVFTHIRDEKGQYAFFFKAENEPSFSVYPNDAHKRLYFDVRGTDRQQEIHDALAQKYYAVAKSHPEIKAELVMPKVPDVDVSKIERPTITRDKDNPAKKYVTATIGGEFMKKEITKSQWDKMWLADDMSAYKRAIAAVVFEPVLKASAQKSQAAEQHTGQPSAQTTGQSASQTAGQASGQGAAQNTQQPEAAKTEQTSGNEDAADDKEDGKEVQQDAEAAGEENVKQSEETTKRPKGVRMG